MSQYVHSRSNFLVVYAKIPFLVCSQLSQKENEEQIHPTQEDKTLEVLGGKVSDNL
jgi:hypothetical protein